MLFQRTVGSDSIDNGYCVMQNGSGDISIAGWTRSHATANGNDAMLTLLNSSNGTPIALRSFGGAGDDRVFAVAPRGASGTFMAGQSNSFGAADNELFILATDDNSDLAFAFTVGGAGAQTASQVIPNDLDDIIVFGNTGGSKGLIATVNTLTGSIADQRTVGTSGTDVASRLVPIPTGGYYMVGYTNVNGDNDFMIIKLDSQLEPVWGRILDAGGDDRGLSAALNDNNELVVVGHTNAFGGQQGTVFKVDGSGSFQWARRTSTSNKTADGDTTESLYFIENVPGVGFRIIGTTTGSGTAGFSDILEMQTDTAGNVGCDTESFTMTVSNFTPVVNTSTGLTVTNVASQVVTTDLSQGSVADQPLNHPATDECRTTVSRAEATQGVRFGVQPNPASSGFHITVNGQGSYSVEVVDITGRKLLAGNGHTNATPHRVETIGWQPGVYLVRVIQNGQSATQRLVVE
jgi:hypothetical protein